MQKLKSALRRAYFLAFTRSLTEAETARSQLRSGIVGAAVVVLALSGTTALYMAPIGKSTYTAELVEAGPIKVGDDVRIAGIPVGNVESLQLQENRVTLQFTVDKSVFVGDQSTLNIRMLTIVGGNYVALSPAGAEPLGDTTIPSHRVKLPYSLAQVFQDAAKPLREVDGATVRKNFASLEESLEVGPDGIRRSVDAVDSLIEILIKQREDVSRTLSIADEYLTAINTSKSSVGELMRRIRILETIVLDKRAEIQESLRVLDEALSRIAVIGPHWDDTIKPLLAANLGAARPELLRVDGELEATVRELHVLVASLQQFVGPDGLVLDHSRAEVGKQEVCIPVPGKAC
ncbi:MlaD family protein [Hoyosella subflava]|uniref:Putative Mce family protein n=1 Tax=Hoyosella subflava (strain DSM 45089 / JCM 17490 / NBRC 109087 / DQS3-9A1) TaxID=443218 RepID=F6ERP1_HOYSD|nr:MlaD family protein [Hoyosella subflava]AEF39618.1 Putative Mce family protein [Hoyosella subflava DQS3-9A1]